MLEELYLKEYYEIVGESRPLSAFFPLMKLSNPPRLLHNRRLKYKLLTSTDYFLSILLFFVSHFMAFYTSSVVF